MSGDQYMFVSLREAGVFWHAEVESEWHTMIAL